MTDFIAPFNRKAAEYEYGNKFLKDALLEYMKEIKYFSVRRTTYDRCERISINLDKNEKMRYNPVSDR